MSAQAPHPLLEGLSGRPGFAFQDGFNQRVYRAPPGLLGVEPAVLRQALEVAPVAAR
jgi:hypothetical protein